MTNNKLPETGFLRLNEVLKLIPVGKTTWWAGVKTGRFPKPIKLGMRITAWRVEDIYDFIQASGNAAGKELCNEKV
jgi:predicted DNA-binding transcriptional regulator AlpA